MQIIDGKQTATEIKKEIASEVERMVQAGQRRPHLAAILVGGSETYVANKVKACEVCGFRSSLIRYENDIDEATLLEEIKRLNEDDEVDGFIVQLPLPKHIDEQKIVEAVDPRKDVDGFHPINVGRQMIGLPCFHSATPAGIMLLLERYGVPTSGANCVILGRSNIVGKPMAALMMQKSNPGNATVTVCHRDTKNLKEICRNADILIAAMGRPGFVTADMVSDGTVVIDVGVNRDPKTGKLCGDVDFESVAPKASVITPVPGGVGPMTICCLMENTIECFLRRFGE